MVEKGRHHRTGIDLRIAGAQTQRQRRGGDGLESPATPGRRGTSRGIHCANTLAELVAFEPQALVLCNPLKAMPRILGELKPLLDEHPGITLTDVGSVKGMVLSQVEQAGW